MGLSAQHCGYDFSSLIAVRPHANGDTTMVEGLRVTLLDSNNVPVTIAGRPIAPFVRNTDRTAWEVPDVRHRPGPQAKYLFPFAEDNYILVVPNNFHTAKMKVLVQDERDAGPLNKRRDQWPVRYKQVVVPLSAFDSYPLCSVFDESVYPELHDRPAFHPVAITLYPR
ncbi:MAG: hypothetical protein IPJ85_13580 [Flavobacteriales bacterium]|nr:hypothetical protein [Flavobacteriales bacterium]